MNAAVAAALVFFAGEGVDPAVFVATEAAVKRQVAGADLSAEHRALTAPSLFVDFAAPPPAFLPPELAAAWKSGSEACAKHTGPTGPQLPPMARASAAATARACREALGLALWDALLEARQVRRVVEVELRAPGRGGALTLSGALHEPGVRRRSLRLEKVSADRAATSAVRMIEDLAAGTGAESPAPRRRVPSVGAPALEAATFGDPQKAAVPAWCKGGLPARLEVFPLGKVTRAIEAGYKTVPPEQRTGAPLRCDLVVYPGYEPAAEPLVNARLACPPAQVRAAEKPGEAPKLISTLVNGAVAALCAPARPK